MYHGLRLKYHHFWHETAHTLAILFLFTWGVFHDSKRLRIYALLFFSNVRAFAKSVRILAFEGSPLDGQSMPKARALIAHSLGTHCP